MNAGYSGADGFQPRGASNTSVIDQFVYANPNGITTRWVHDASAGTIKAHAIQRNSSTYLSNSGGSALVSIGDTSQSDGSGRKNRQVVIQDLYLVIIIVQEQQSFKFGINLL